MGTLMQSSATEMYFARTRLPALASTTPDAQTHLAFNHTQATKAIKHFLIRVSGRHTHTTRCWHGTLQRQPCPARTWPTTASRKAFGRSRSTRGLPRAALTRSSFSRAPASVGASPSSSCSQVVTSQRQARGLRRFWSPQEFQRREEDTSKYEIKRNTFQINLHDLRQFRFIC